MFKTFIKLELFYEMYFRGVKYKQIKKDADISL